MIEIEIQMYLRDVRFLAQVCGSRFLFEKLEVRILHDSKRSFTGGFAVSMAVRNASEE